MSAVAVDAGSTAADLAACRAILAAGSKSFAMASLLLPARVREPAAAVYAFCRVADDAVDDAADPRAGLAGLRERLDGVFAGAPRADPVDRALARVVAAHDLPRAPFDGLLEGFAWDVEERTYGTLDEVVAYGARVAGTVGIIMTHLMGPRDPRVLARACDLGVAMQLTNIARDVGEDARRGRVYLPSSWLDGPERDPAWIAREGTAPPSVRRAVERLVAEADAIYARADLGVPMLPRDCRPAIRAARLIYSDLHRAIRGQRFDTVARRAVVSKGRKVALALRSLGSSFGRSRSPAADDPPPLPEVAFLLEPSR